MNFVEMVREMRRRVHSRAIEKPHQPEEILPAPPVQPPPSRPRRPLGDLLVERRLISREQLNRALQHQRGQMEARKLLGEILIAKTGMSEQQLLETLAVQARSVLGIKEPAAVAEGDSGIPLASLARKMAAAAELEPAAIPEWIREFAAHANFPALSPLAAPVPSAEQAAEQPAEQPRASLAEEVALLQAEPFPAPSLPTAALPVPMEEKLAPSGSLRILVAIGSRPEAIKLAPVIRELERGRQDGPLCGQPAAPPRVFVCVTGQPHGQVEEALLSAGVHVDLNLNLMTFGQSPAELGARLLRALTTVIEEFVPDWVLVQGDSVTPSMASLAAVYAGVRVAHVASGLRLSISGQPDRRPQELQRRMIGLAAQVHFAPTPWARQNLLRDGVDPRDILVTGDTGIDALRNRSEASSLHAAPPAGAGSGTSPVRVLVAACLRPHPEPDSEEKRIAALCSAVLNLANRNPGRYLFLWPLEPDPNLMRLAGSLLDRLDDVLLAGPASHEELLEYLEKSDIVLTDSGALQEEAASFGKPVLILRETTERSEGVYAGLAWLIGTRRERIERALEELAHQVDERRTLGSAANPYGDGFAGVRIADFFAGRQVAEFRAPEAEEELPRQVPSGPRHQPVEVA